MAKLSKTKGAGEDEEVRYDACYQGEPRAVKKILEAIVQEGNKDHRLKREIFSFAVTDRDDLNYAPRTLLMETG